MDQDDQQWYNDSVVNAIDNNTVSILSNEASGSAIIAQNVALPRNVTTEQPTAISEEIARNCRKSRKLVRFDSEQAMNLFLHKSNMDDNSSDNDLQ